MVKCKECGHEISTNARACPNCGRKVSRKPWWIIIPILAIAAFLAIGAMLEHNDPLAGERSRARSVIKLCWKDYERKSFDDDVKRFIAGTCERLEDDFRKKYRAEP